MRKAIATTLVVIPILALPVTVLVGPWLWR
jgi:hypothetical protein